MCIRDRSTEEKTALRATLVERFDDIMGVISEVDVARANATNPDDKAMIFGLIDAREGGVAQFNADLIAALRGWLLDAARAELDAMVSERGDDDLDANTLRDVVALLLKELGHYGEAERQHRKALAVRKSALGDKHPDVACLLYTSPSPRDS